MLAIAEAGGHSPMYALVEAGGWPHLPGLGDLDGTSFIAGDDSLHYKQRNNHISIMFIWNREKRV